MIMTFKDKFCKLLYTKFYHTFYTKYGVLFRMMLILDEWVYLVSDQRLFEDDDDRETYRKYIKVSRECNKYLDLAHC